jgi:hypothetical protein
MTTIGFAGLGATARPGRPGTLAVGTAGSTR